MAAGNAGDGKFRFGAFDFVVGMNSFRFLLFCTSTAVFMRILYGFKSDENFALFLNNVSK